MKFNEKFTQGGNKKITKKFLMNFLKYLWKCNLGDNFARILRNIIHEIF